MPERQAPRSGGPSIEEYCTVELEDDDTLRVRSWIEFGPRSPSTGMDSVALDPRLLECDAPALQAGQYTVIHGERTSDFEVPSEGNLDRGDR